jgi:3-oxoacyl-[acyl-carrier-protein] synthase II
MHFGPASTGEAFDLLREGAASAILTGGFDELSEYILELCHESGLAIQNAGDAALPYEATSAGLLPSEGSVFFLLERAEAAVVRGAKIQAWLKGYSVVTDRSAIIDATARSSSCWIEVIRRALQDAGVGIDEVSFVLGAANGLATGDSAELEAIRMTLPEDVPVFSLKGLIGETWGASGGFAILASVLALQENGAMLIPSGQRRNVHPGPALVLSSEMTAQNTAFVLDRNP